MIKALIVILLFQISLINLGFSQRDFIYSKEGKEIMDRTKQLQICLKSLKKDRTDPTAVAICNCQLNLIDGHFTNKQYKKYTTSHMIDMQSLMDEDTVFKHQVQACYNNSGKTILMQAEGFETEFIADCIKNLQKNTKKNLEMDRLVKFCTCQIALIKSKKIKDDEMETLANPNSLLFYEMMFKCGDPYSGADSGNNWTSSSEHDIIGPGDDTVHILTLDGMTYVKINLGGTTQFWLLDTGATDLLINTDMETTLKNEHIITPANYLGIGEYELANGTIDTCRKYRIDILKIGKFTLNNIRIAVTDKGKKIIAGKALLNKFRYWILNNKDNVLVLYK